ncbi:MAG: hypothetical protein M1819_001994 [Sarea resinae]|nr:MAG: hypothetical protein M1819_001994 [Sarea resinae]
MYFRSLHKLGRLSDTDLPILPFLAPRLLTQWPPIPNPRLLGTRAHQITTNATLSGQPQKKESLRYAREQFVDKDAKSAYLKSLREDKARAYSRRWREKQRKARRPEEKADKTRPRVTTKWLYLRPTRVSVAKDGRLFTFGLEPFWRKWNKRFALLDAKYDPRNTARSEPVRLRQLQLRQQTESWVEELLAGGLDAKSMAHVWAQWDVKDQTDRWPDIMLWTLFHSPETALEILEATHVYPYPPGQAVSDSLQYIASHFLQGKKDSNPTIVGNVLRVLPKLLDRQNTPPLNISQKTIYTLLRHSDAKQVKQLYHSLTDSDVPLHENTLLQFAHHLAAHSSFRRTMHALQTALDLGIDPSSDRIQSVCVFLLRQAATRSEGGYVLSSRLLSQLLEMGIQPNVVLYNVIILNAFEGNDPETAWRIFDMLKGNGSKEDGIRTDAYTYSILANHAKRSGDRSTIDYVLRSAHEEGILPKSPHILTDLLDAIATSSASSDAASTFSACLATYRAYFSIQPLKDLTLVPPSTPQQQPPLRLSSSVTGKNNRDQPLLEPGAPTLGIMVSAFLKACEDPGRVQALYLHYRRLLTEGRHPLVSALARSDHVANAFLMALGRSAKTLPLCPRVIEDMLTPLPAAPRTPGAGVDADANADLENKNQTTANENFTTTSASSSSSSHPPSHHAPPTTQTWTILLHAYLTHAQPRAAAKVRQLMTQRAIVPSQVTYNTLVAGYAGMQDTRRVVEALREMRARGCDVDGWTVAGIRKLRHLGDREEVVRWVGEGAGEREREREVEGEGKGQGRMKAGRVERGRSVDQDVREDMKREREEGERVTAALVG